MANINGSDIDVFVNGKQLSNVDCATLLGVEIDSKLSFIHFTHGFRSLHGSELTYFWKLCPARRQQLTFFNQA